MSLVRVRPEPCCMSCLPSSLLTLTVSAVVVFAALLGPGRKLTNSLTAHPAEMIVQAMIPRRVPVLIPVAWVQTKLCCSLEKNRIMLISTQVMYKAVMSRFLNRDRSYRVIVSGGTGWWEEALSTEPLRYFKTESFSPAFTARILFYSNEVTSSWNLSCVFEYCVTTFFDYRCVRSNTMSNISILVLKLYLFMK